MHRLVREHFKQRGMLPFSYDSHFPHACHASPGHLSLTRSLFVCVYAACSHTPLSYLRLAALRITTL